MEWYYAKHGKQDGPVDLAVLQGKLQSGEITPTDLVWKEGMAEWTAAGDVPEVAAPAPAGAPPISPSVSPVNPAGQVPSPSPVAAGGYQPPQGGISPTVVAPPTSGLAIASMVCGIIGIMLCYLNGLLALPAVICGHMALKKIDKSLTPIGGRGMAVAGLVTGYIGLVFQVLFIVVIAFTVASEM